VIEHKVAQNEANKTRAANAAKLAHLKEIAAAKENENITSQSLDEIRKQISELELLAV
jgi:hypothetical protein